MASTSREALTALGPEGARSEVATTAEAEAAAAEVGASFALFRAAVALEGRRHPCTPVVDPAFAAGARPSTAGAEAPPGAISFIPLLDHAGPASARWSAERPLGPADVPSPWGGRRPRPLDEAGWRQVRAQFRAAARVVAPISPVVMVDVAGGGLLASMLSPLAHPDATEAARLARVVEVLAEVRCEVRALGVLLTVEEVAGGGLDPQGGIDAARAAVDAGAEVIVAAAGSAWLPRRGAVSLEASLDSAGWLPGRVSVPVYAEVEVPRMKDDALHLQPRAGADGALGRARARGLAGLVWVGLALCAPLAGCATATERAPYEATPAAPAGPAEGALAPPPPTRSESPAFDPVPIEQRVRQWQREDASLALACWSGFGCEPGAADVPTLTHAELALLLRAPTTAAERRLRQALAAIVLDRAAARRRVGVVESSADRRLLLWAGASPFLLDDLPGLLVHAAPARRRELVAAAAAPLAERWAGFLAVRAAVTDALASSGVTWAALLAARAGLTEAALVEELRAALSPPPSPLAHPGELPAALAAEVNGLDERAALGGALVELEPSGEAASELASPLPACFLIDPPHEVRLTAGRGREPSTLLAERHARGAARAASLTPAGEIADRLFVAAVAELARRSAPRVSPAAEVEAAAASSWRLRLLVASTLALLEAPEDPARLDELASLAAGTPPTPGAGALLVVSPSGEVAEALARVRGAEWLEPLLSAALGPRWAIDADPAVAARVLADAFAAWRAVGPTLSPRRPLRGRPRPSRRSRRRRPLRQARGEWG